MSDPRPAPSALQLALPFLVVEPGPPGGPLMVRALPRQAPATPLLPPAPALPRQDPAASPMPRASQSSAERPPPPLLTLPRHGPAASPMTPAQAPRAAPRPLAAPIAALVRERVRDVLAGSPGPAAPDPELRSLEYVVVDVETTGGSALRGHRVTEVAALRVAWDGTILDELATLVNPGRPIPPFISALTNITWDMVRDAPVFAEIAADVRRMVAGRVFVAHNASFDWRFLTHELERATGERPDERVLCTVRLARKVVPEVASRSLDSLTYFFGLENEARHRAYGDARVTAALLGRMMARLEEREVVSWAGLEELLYRRKARKPRARHATPSSMDPSEIPAQ